MKVGGSGSITQSSTTHTSGGGMGLTSPKYQQDPLAVQMRQRYAQLERDDSGSSLSHHTHSTEPESNMRNAHQSTTPGSARSASDSATHAR